MKTLFIFNTNVPGLLCQFQEPSRERRFRYFNIRSIVGTGLLGHFNRHSRERRFRNNNKVRGQFRNGRLRIVLIFVQALFIRSAIGTGLLGHFKINSRGLHTVLTDRMPDYPPPPLRVVGSSVLTDPRGEPLPPDQSSFSARRRSVAIFGDIIRKPVCIFSAFQPGNINGKVTSKVGQRFAP